MNTKDDLGNLVKSASSDINEISTLVRSLQRYRGQFSDMKNLV
jgi:hypothetical protein